MDSCDLFMDLLYHTTKMGTQQEIYLIFVIS